MESADKGTNSNSEIRGSDRIDTRTPLPLLLPLLLTLSPSRSHERINASYTFFLPPRASPCDRIFRLRIRLVPHQYNLFRDNEYVASMDNGNGCFTGCFFFFFLLLLFFSFLFAREDSFLRGSRSLDVRRDFSLSGGNLLAERVSRPVKIRER